MRTGKNDRRRMRDGTATEDDSAPKLIAMAMCGYDRVIVEPSGIYDVDEFVCIKG